MDLESHVLTLTHYKHISHIHSLMWIWFVKCIVLSSYIKYTKLIKSHSLRHMTLIVMKTHFSVTFLLSTKKTHLDKSCWFVEPKWIDHCIFWMFKKFECRPRVMHIFSTLNLSQARNNFCRNWAERILIS